MTDKWTFVKNKERDVHEVLSLMQEDQKTFSQWVKAAIERSGMRKSDVIRHSFLNQTFGYQIIAGHRRATRDKLIQLAFGMQLNIEQTSELLERAGKNQLSVSNPRDVVIAYCIARHMTIPEVGEVLDDLNMTPLWK